MTPKPAPAPEIEDDTDPILESARNPRPIPESSPLVGEPDLFPLWSISRFIADRAEWLPSLEQTEQRLQELRMKRGT